MLEVFYASLRVGRVSKEVNREMVVQMRFKKTGKVINPHRFYVYHFLIARRSTRKKLTQMEAISANSAEPKVTASTRFSAG